MDTDREKVQFEFGVACDIGRKRKSEPNQDTVKVVLPNPGEPWHPPLLLVADGMGRYFGGAIASQSVVRTFGQVFKQAEHPANYPLLLDRCVQAAHQEVRAQGAKDEKLAHMGSTLVAVVLNGPHLYSLNVGDSRAYILRNKIMRQVSEDHSWAMAQIRAGVLSEQEARSHPSRNRLLMAITAKRTEVKSHKAAEMLEPYDVILLCSDGLWGVVPESLIFATANELPPQAAADKLVKLANNSKGPDNISVIIARRSDVSKKTTTADLEDTVD
jgi:serine/threonine protein phosphatase PrpC